MTQYITTDFSDHPADWTSRYDTLGTWSVTGGDLGLSAGKSNDWRVLSWNDIDADANRDNVEVLALVRFVSFSGTNYFLTVRGSGADESATLYSVAATSSTLRLYYCSGSDFPNLINSSSFTISGSTDYWVRFRVDATSLKARIWADGASEPGAWLLDEVDSSVTGVGWVGAAAYGTQTPATWKQIGVGTNGDTAPSSAGGGGATSLGFGPRFPRAILNF